MARRTLSVANWRRAELAYSPGLTPRWRMARIVLGLLAASACYAIGVQVALWISPVPPVGLYLVRAGYLDNLAIPPNTPGLYSADAFAALHESPAGRSWLRSWAGGFGAARVVDLREHSSWNHLLRDVKEPTVLIDMTGQAGADEAGAFVYGDDPRTVDWDKPARDRVPEHPYKIYLKTMIADLAAPEHRNQQFLVVLDVAKAADNVALGMLKNDFNDRLAELDGKLTAGNVVLLAPGFVPGPQPLEATGRSSAFGHAIVAGLRGAAAGGNGRIDIQTLVAHVGQQLPGGAICLPRGAERSRTPLALARSGNRMPTSVRAGSPPTVPAQVEPDSWSSGRQLAVTGPESYAPHRWRQYRDILLRHEALGRQLTPGDSATADEVRRARDRLRATLIDLEGELRAAREIRLLASAQASLSIPAVQGPTPEPADAWRAPFEQLWLTPATEPVGPIVERDRLPLYDLLLRRVESSSGPDDLGRAATLLARLQTPDRSRPAEAHFLAILLRDRPPGLFETPEGRLLVAEAIQVRRQAERVSAGATGGLGPGVPALAEQIAPLIASVVAEADKHRHLGEDLLFAADPARWAEARAALARARARYDEAAAAGGQLRAALAVRDQAFANLPYFADWVAANLDLAATASLVEEIEQTWAAAHDLAELLVPVFASDKIAARTRRATAGLQALRAQFGQEVATRRVAKPSAKDRRALLALLDTPFLDPESRAKLQGQLAATGVEPPPDRSDAQATRNAAAVGRLALAAQGRTWFNDAEYAPIAAGTADPEKFADVQTRLADLNGGMTVAKAGAIDPLNRFGTRIGRSQRLLRAAIEARSGSELKDGFGPWLARLQEVDRLGRTLLGVQRTSGQTEIPGVLRLEPTALYRRRLVQLLLLHQAERTIDGHWFAEGDDPAIADDPTAPPPYYRVVAERFLADLKLVGRSTGVEVPEIDRSLTGELTRVEGRLAEPARLVVQGPPDPLVVTDEPSLQLRYRVEAPAGTRREPEGRPVVWLALDPPADVQLDDPMTAGRRDLPIDPPRPEGGEAGLFPRAGPDNGWVVGQLGFPQVKAAAERPDSIRQPRIDRGTFRFEGRHRGQVLRERTRFEVHPIPEILVTHQPPPPTGSVAVQADPALISRYGGVEGGALAIVLDCSRSMGPPRGAADDAPSKYREATAAIRQVLGRVTRGTRVSLWVFGEALWPNRTAPKPEDTIQPILRPVVWRPNDAALLDDVIRRIEPPALEPWNESPIVETMIRASADLRAVPGFKSLVVLTDGKDNCFDRARKPTDGPKVEIGKALADAFRGSDIEISIVGYKIDDAEGEVRQQLKAIELMRPPGRFFPVRQAEALGETLASALKPMLRYSVQTVNNVPIRGAVELGVQPGATPDFHGIEPGHYKLVAETGIWSERPMTIHQGDKLIVRLADAGRQVAMNRVTWTDTLPTRPRNQDAGDWRLSVLRSRRTPEQGLSLWASLEHLPDPRESALEVIRPDFLWLEVSPQGNGPAPFQQRWRRLSGLPAPTWELSVPAWPAGPRPDEPAEPHVRAFWDPHGEGEPVVALTRADFRSIDEVRERRLTTPRGTVVIESIRVEPVDPRAGGSLKRLVVRLNHAPNQRFWVRPTGLTSGWSEHRFYTRAGKSTGVFWPLTDEQIRATLTGLELISVEEFRETARRRGFAVEDLAADLPTADNRGPDLGPDPSGDVPITPPLPGVLVR